MLKVLLITHRYVAVAVGLLVALWCLSGFVMMYQGYPEFTRAELLRSLAPLELTSCCESQFLPPDDEPLTQFRIETLEGEPVLRQRGVTPIRLRTGMPVQPLKQAQLLGMAAEFAQHMGLKAEPVWRGAVDVDQWTLQTARRNQPAHRFALQDAAGTELYINAASGEIFQDTNRRERALSWFGAIPHWLYFSGLRRNGPLWAQIVIWTSVLGTFLTLTGLAAGIIRLRWKRAGRGESVSPFRGWWYWHHMLGLFFGLLTLTWVFSGLLTMNPWGLLEGGEAETRLRPQLNGATTVAGLRHFLESAPTQLAGSDFVQLRGETFGGKLQVIGLRADGSAVRLDGEGRPDPLDGAKVEALVRGLDTGVEHFDLMKSEDAYWYAHKEPVELPVYRAILGDAGHTRLYISPVTGSINVLDASGRRTRWWDGGLHQLDFRGLRQRPLWDIVTLLLLAGVTALAITGSWMALQRIRKDLSGRG